MTSVPLLFYSSLGLALPECQLRHSSEYKDGLITGSIWLLNLPHGAREAETGANFPFWCRLSWVTAQFRVWLASLAWWKCCIDALSISIWQYMYRPIRYVLCFSNSRCVSMDLTYIFQLVADYTLNIWSGPVFLAIHYNRYIVMFQFVWLFNSSLQ